MSDIMSPERRSWNMSRIRAKDTSIEIKVRKWLFQKGYRYRKNVKSLPGKPDILLNSYKTVIFVHGCFWHHHPGCKYAYNPKSRVDFWNSKFEKNKNNDLIHKKDLELLGYNVLVLWECEIKEHFEETMRHVAESLGAPKLQKRT